MWGVSYSASCAYLTNTAYNATSDTGSCADLSDGFVYLLVAHLAIALLYTIILMISLTAFKVWNKHNRAEDKKPEMTDQEFDEMAISGAVTEIDLYKGKYGRDRAESATGGYV